MLTRARLPMVLAGLALCAGLVQAQFPKDVFLGGFTSGGPAPPVWISQGGVLVPMTGTTPAEQEINAVAYDPWDASLWIGGINTAPTPAGAGQIRHLQYNAAGAMTSSVLVTTLPTAPSSVAGLAFSRNDYRLYASSGSGGFRVDPFTGATVQVAGPAVPAGTYNAVVVGPVTGNVYWGVTGTGGRITMTPKGATADTLLGTVSPPSGSTTISGLAVNPTETALYVATFGSGNNSLLAFPLPAGPAALLGPPVPALPALNDVEWDHSKGMLVVSSAGTDPDNVWDVNPLTGANVLRATAYPAPGGAPANVDINDSGKALKLLPEKIQTQGPFNLCISLWGQPGAGAAIYIVAIQAPGAAPILVPPILLALGGIDFRGCLALGIALPAGIFVPGGPNIKFYLVGAIVKPGVIEMTPVVSWPAM